MADFCINIFMDEGKQKKIEEAGLADQVKEIDGKKAVQVGVNKKEHKKLSKSFPGMDTDSSNCCVLPEEGENTLMGFISDMKTLDVMKAAIMKLYNPVAGKDIRSKLH